MRRELLMAVEPSLFDDIAGSTDSEVLFYLALTFGLEDDPSAAWNARSALWRRPAASTASSTPCR